MTTMVAKRSRTFRWVLPLIALFAATAVVLPPLININRFHHRIAESIGGSIGRPVNMSSVKMRLLPRPGFEIEDLVVEEDPAFGAEPILRCAHVTAYIRLLSLWRGRLEIARIAFDEPSLNLVRNKQGRWNFGSVLTQAAQIPNAPTAQRHAGGLLRFPYIDASDARVNFKFGDEKMPVSFLNADLAVWLSNPGEWRIQFAAQPARTDLTLDLANTGTLRLEGTLRRSPGGDQAIGQMPANLHLEWSNAPLGQLSRIFMGADADWRGELEVSADISGNADHARVTMIAKGRGIHRAEFEPRQPLNVDATCQAQFVRTEHLLDAITCLIPAGEGHLLLTGSVRNMAGKVTPALSLEVNHLPAARAVDGLRLVRSGFAPQVEVKGAINGSFVYAASNRSPYPELQGQATVDDLTLAAPAFEKPWTLPVLHFGIVPNSGEHPRRGLHAVSLSGPRSPGSLKSLREESALRLEPVALGQAVASATPLTLSGAFTGSGFSIRILGQSRTGQVAALSKEFGLLRIHTMSFGREGTADVDVTVHGPWLSPVTDSDHPSVATAIEGTIRLHNAEMTGDFLAQPLQIASAQATIGNNRVDWSAVSFSYGPVHADGTLSYPVFCTVPPNCIRQFGVHIASLDAATAQNALLGATRHGEIVQQLLDRINERIGADQHLWPTLSGTMQIGSLALGPLTVRDLTASLNIEANAVQIKSLTGHALAGAALIGPLRLSGAMQMSAGVPHYEIEGQLDHASTSALAALFLEKWGTGTINLTTAVKLAGYEREQLTSSASGTFGWEWAKGGLPVDPLLAEGKVLAVSAKPASQFSAGDSTAAVRIPVARFDTWTAEGTIANGALHLGKSQIVSGEENYRLTGTIDFTRQMNVVVDVKPGPVKITGSLEKPVAAAVPLEP
jgi:hypothetical protein